jgi:formate--tetrahydrofolate ligase
MAALLADAAMPNLLQTTEGTPCLVHAGPFANIAHGNSSVVADRIALALADAVVTEAGFGADMGAEKFFNIKCRAGGLWPDAAVMVASVRALKMHGLAVSVKPGKPLPRELVEENLEALDRGCANLDKQIENVLAYGVPVVAAVNRFPGDTARELELVLARAKKAGAVEAAASDVFARGGAGGEDLARAVVRAASPTGAKRPTPQFLYPDDWPLERKIDTIARRMYGAGGVEYTGEAREALARLARWGFERLPICMAKTQYSLSHDPAMRGRPEGFVLPVREVRLSAGAGFVTPVSGKIQLMPGLGSTPSLTRIDVDAAGRILGF